MKVIERVEQLQAELQDFTEKYYHAHTHRIVDDLGADRQHHKSEKPTRDKRRVLYSHAIMRSMCFFVILLFV